MLKIKFILISYMLCYLALGCGYRFSETELLNTGINKIFVPIFKNKTDIPEAGAIFSNDLSSEFTKNSNIKIVGKDESNAQIIGNIKSIKIETISRESQHKPLERRIKIYLDLKLEDKAGNTIWSRKNSEYTQSYIIVNENKLLTEENKKAALEKISQRYAEEIYLILTSNF
ncbi:MAG: hypothetical protein HQK76_14265 [Desulfobacterales bacterium]|nr:hypothetical protein [Desulfobacterales bacterium]